MSIQESTISEMLSTVLELSPLSETHMPKQWFRGTQDAHGLASLIDSSTHAVQRGTAECPHALIAWAAEGVGSQTVCRVCVIHCKRAGGIWSWWNEEVQNRLTETNTRSAYEGTWTTCRLRNSIFHRRFTLPMTFERAFQMCPTQHVFLHITKEMEKL